MTSADELPLLEALLDAFDRLFDRQTTVVDVHALLYATARALADSAFGKDVAAAESALEEIMRSDRGPAEAVEQAIDAVDPLRRRIADRL
ncbi:MULTISPECIES: hypothetical protein [unclassified Micromonospora]|uniref:hypothetical protein n=1 Tax=unclassified Micromonospora TaxID=2617518 RepID=UPI0036A27DA4|nr:hypothetical protein OG990_35630 [Micromonospora sp. NBC_00858]